MCCYVSELHKVINYCVEKFGDRKIYLIGESWGGGIAIAYQKKYYDTVASVYAWNIPNRVKDTSNRGFLKKLAIVPSMF
jgi:alpha-beta hydrolase superfamily lysophospholipase